MSVAALLSLSLLAALPSEEDHALPCRPTIACTADFVAPGVFELEAGGLLRRVPGGEVWGTPFLLKLTLAEWGQLQVSSGGGTWSPGPARMRYFDSVTAGLKLHLQDQTAALPSVSFSVAAGIPTAPSLGYPRMGEGQLTAYVTKDFGWLHADLNLGATIFRPEGEGALQPWAALALSVALPHGLSPVAELYGFGRADGLAPEDSGVLLALALQPWPWVVLDAGVDVGLIPGTRQLSAFAGVTVIPVDLWDTSEEERARLLRRTQHER